MAYAGGCVLAVGPFYRRFTGWVAALGSAENVYTETESTKQKFE